MFYASHFLYITSIGIFFYLFITGVMKYRKYKKIMHAHECQRALHCNWDDDGSPLSSGIILWEAEESGCTSDDDADQDKITWKGFAYQVVGYAVEEVVKYGVGQLIKDVGTEGVSVFFKAML